GIWNENPLKIDLAVAIPWWNRLWFKGGVILLLLAGIYAFYRYRLFQVRRVERMRSDFENKLAGVELAALRSQMNPHFIFNCLNSIESYIIRNETRKASEYLNDFSRLIRLILQNSRSNYVTVRDELDALTLYMDMENLRLGQRFDYKVSLDEHLDVDDVEMPPMLLQPYVENAIWHGLMHKKENGTILVDLKIVDGYLLCAIEDNGVGRKRSSELQSRNRKKTSMGMNITQERIDIINKAYDTETSVRVIDLVSPEGVAQGTRVELRIMLG
ncbi:MAG: histidine kinase, partial [Saprospiraceae bacterium]|nr:histidine kinase [Saprospiraceae bacterium]